MIRIDNIVRGILEVGEKIVDRLRLTALLIIYWDIGVCSLNFGQKT